jgi:hypothetical protein
MENFKDLLLAKNPNYSAKTIETYATTWKSLKTMFERENDAIDFLFNTKEVVDKLVDKYSSLNTLKTKLAVCVAIMRLIDEAKCMPYIESYNFEIDKCSIELSKMKATHEKTEKMEKGWISVEEEKQIEVYLLSLLHKGYKCYSNVDLVNLRNYVIFKLQNHISGRNELAHSLIEYSNPHKTNKTTRRIYSDEYNYICLSRREKKVYYILNVYKTAKTYGQKIIDLGTEYYELLKCYNHALLVITPQIKGAVIHKDTMFYDSDCKTPLSANRFGVVYSSLGDIINKKLSTTTQRHIKASSVGLSAEQIEKIKSNANMMNHSLETHLDYAVV